MKKFYYYLHLPVLLLTAVSAAYFFSFTAEDAYITYRYAENLVNTGLLIYNEGEPINAMTSPLHAILSAALFYVTGQTVLANKIVALILVLFSALLVWQRFRNHPQWQVLSLILILMSSPVLLWTVGGLETPVLLFLATLTVILLQRTPPFNLGLLCLIFFLTGLAFLTRYDSILFFLPAVLFATLRARSASHVVAAVLGGAMVPIAWLAVSVLFYGDLLPTSFYVKTPIGNLWGLLFNGRYIASYLLFAGIIPVVVLVFVLLIPQHRTMDVLYRHIRRMWWLYAGLVLEILYGLTMATHHMMFSFRFFVPYLPATVILVLDLVGSASEISNADLATGKSAYPFAGFLLCLMLFQVYQNVYTYNHSVNGISSIGEYKALGIRDYANFMQILKLEAVDIEKHWDATHGDGDRRPRIITFAAGMLPYTYRESYIYEKLVSYRHCHQRYRQELYADYIHILVPRQGQVDEQLPRPVESYTLVSSYEMLFDGSMQNFLVYYNPEPEAHNLSAGIYDPCRQDERASN